MDAAKIRLSTEEAALISRSDWILTKNNILVKVKRLLESLQLAQKDLLSPSTLQHPAWVAHHPKISKGENYRGLPYLVLDNPRCFEKSDVLAIRTMFWWGNFFSTTLQLSGKYKDQYENKIIQSFTALKEHGFYVCVHSDPWEYHFEDNNYLPLQEMNEAVFENIIHGNSFIKISAKIPLEKWDDAEIILTGLFGQLIRALSV